MIFFVRISIPRLLLPALPFSREQAEQLTQLLAGASSHYQQGDWADPAEIDWTSVDAQTAARILSAEQLALFKSVEPNGPRGAGARYLTRLNRLIDEAAGADAAIEPPKN